MPEAHRSHAWRPNPLNLKNLALAHTRAQFLDAKGDPSRTIFFFSCAGGRAPRWVTFGEDNPFFLSPSIDPHAGPLGSADSKGLRPPAADPKAPPPKELS